MEKKWSELTAAEKRAERFRRWKYPEDVDFVNDEAKDRPAPKQADHLMDCLKYGILAGPRFLASRAEEIGHMENIRPKSSITGY